MFQGCAAYDTIVDGDQIVDVGSQAAVSNIVYVCGEVVACVAFGDERAQFYILDNDFFGTYAHGENTFQIFPGNVVLMGKDIVGFQSVEVFFKTFHHTEESNLCRVGNERKDRVLNVVIDSFEQRPYQILP